MSEALRRRDEIPVEHTWDIGSVFSSDAAWEAAIVDVEVQLDHLQSFQNHLGDGPARLADWFEQSEALFTLVGKIFVYASSNFSVDTGNQAAAALSGRARSLAAHVNAATAFADPEILAIGADTLKCWVAADPRLAIYHHAIDSLERRRAHIRSAEVEQVLGMAGDAFGTASATHAILANADLRFEPAIGSDGQSYDVAQGTIGAIETHADRTARRSGYENYTDAHLAFKNTMANALIAGVKQNVFDARVRGYPSSLAAALESNHIPVAVFHNLIATFRQHLPTWHRYWRIRRHALGYEKLHVHDIKAPLVPAPHIPYEQAVDWIAAGMQPLGDDYVASLRRGALQERWVDIYPNQGKRMGAFSSGVKGTYPFIMMSYTDDLFSLSTLAHELGHSLHSYLAWQNQPYTYAQYGLFVAEVASNFNQALVRAHLLAGNDDPAFQIAVIEEAMSNFHRYFFIMPTLARFELEVHERVERGEALSADDLIGLMTDLFREGYGDEVEINHDRVGITWATFHSHLYANFYVYQYATGISGAHALADGILAQKPGAVDNYLSFLRAGASLYPLDALKLAGVDLATPDPVETTFGVLARMVDRLEQLTMPATAVNA